MTNDQIGTRDMWARQVRKHIPLVSIIVSLAAIFTSLAVYIHAMAQHHPSASPSSLSLSQHDAYKAQSLTAIAQRSKSGDDRSHIDGERGRHEQAPTPIAATSVARAPEARASTDPSARAGELLDRLKETLHGLIADNTKLKESVAELQAERRKTQQAFTTAKRRHDAERQKSHQQIKRLKTLLTATKGEDPKALKAGETIQTLRAELSAAHQALTIAKQRHRADKQKSDQLIADLTRASMTAKREADALATRQQELLAEHQATIIETETRAQLRAELVAARQALTAATRQRNAEKQKSDQLIEKLRQVSNSTKREAEALAARHQKLLAEHQAALIETEASAQLRAELSAARQALTAARQQRDAEKQKSDRLIGELKDIASAAKKDAEALSERHQKLAASHQTTITARARAEAALSASNQKLSDIEKKYQRVSAALEEMLRPKRARERALAQQRLTTEARNVARQHDETIQLATEKLKAFDRDVAQITPTLQTAAATSARGARELTDIDQDLATIERSEAAVLQDVRKAASEIEEHSKVLARNEHSLQGASKAIEAHGARLEQFAKHALDLQKTKSSIHSRVTALITAGQSAHLLSKTVDAAFSAIAKKVASLDLTLRDDRDGGLPNIQSGEKALSSTETNLQGTTSEVEAAEQLLSQLTTAQTKLKDQIAPLSKDASRLSLEISKSQGELRGYVEKLKELSQSVQNQVTPIADESNYNTTTTLSRYSQDVGKQRHLLSALWLDFARIDKDVREASERILAAKDLLEDTRAVLLDQTASMKRAQATTEAMKAQIKALAQPMSDGVKLAKLDSDQDGPLSSSRNENAEDRLSQARSDVDTSMARIVKTSQELNARIKHVSKLEAELDASGRELEKMKNWLSQQIATTADLDPRRAQLERRYDTLLAQNKAFDRAQSAHQERASTVLARVLALQNRLPRLQSQLQSEAFSDEVTPQIASLRPIIATEKSNQWRIRLTAMREKLSALSLALQARRSMPPPALKRDTATSDRPTEPSNTPAALVSRRAPEQSQEPAAQISRVAPAQSQKPATHISRGAPAQSKKPEAQISKLAPNQSQRPTPKISVECDLKRASCRKWLFLRKKRLEAKSDRANASRDLAAD